MNSNYYENYLQSTSSSSGNYPKSETQKVYAQVAWEMTGGKHGSPHESIGKYWNK